MATNPLFHPIKEEHILLAFEEIDTNGVPAAQKSKNWLVEFKGKVYPPKYVLCVASRFAPMQELEAGDFWGGEPTNNVFRALGFTVVETPSWAEHLRNKS